jgi:regulator of replication initiation timing
VADDIVTRLRHVSWLAEEGSAVVDLATAAADEIMRTREQIDVLKIELAQARTGRALLEVERLQAENDELRRRLAEGFATSVVIDVSHENAARKLRQVMRTIEALTEGNEQ